MNIRAFISMNRKNVTHYIKQTELDPGENNQLVFDFGSYDLSDKRIFVEIKPRAYRTEVFPAHGLLFVGVKEIMLRNGLNQIQVYFEDIDGNVEKSPIIEWEVKKTASQNAV